MPNFGFFFWPFLAGVEVVIGLEHVLVFFLCTSIFRIKSKSFWLRHSRRRTLKGFSRSGMSGFSRSVSSSLQHWSTISRSGSSALCCMMISDLTSFSCLKWDQSSVSYESSRVMTWVRPTWVSRAVLCRFLSLSAILATVQFCCSRALWSNLEETSGSNLWNRTCKSLRDVRHTFASKYAWSSYWWHSWHDPDDIRLVLDLYIRRSQRVWWKLK